MKKFDFNKNKKIEGFAGWNEGIDWGYNFNSFMQAFECGGSYWNLNEWLFE
jgi:hypothetical protein